MARNEITKSDASAELVETPAADVATVSDALTVEQLRQELLDSVIAVGQTKREQLAGRMIALRSFVGGVNATDNPTLFGSNGKLVMERVYAAILGNTDDANSFVNQLQATAKELHIRAESISRATLDRYWKGSQLLLDYELPISQDTASPAYRATESADAMKRTRAQLDALQGKGKLEVASLESVTADAQRAANAASAAKKLATAPATAESDGEGDDAPPPSVEQMSEIIRRQLDKLEGLDDTQLRPYRDMLTALAQYVPGSISSTVDA
jgi:hypothetical protein